MLFALTSQSWAQTGTDIFAPLENLTETPEFTDRPSVARPQLPESIADPNRTPFLEWSHLTDGWFGLRANLQDRGINFESTLTIDGSQNLQGGISSRGIVRHLYDANVSLDSEKLGLWSNGFAFFDFQSLAGRTGDRIVNDIQVFDNIDSNELNQFSQFWYEHHLFDHTLRIKAGKVDANSEFAYVEHGTLFVNSSMGFSPTVVLFPSYPDPAFGLNVFLHPSDFAYLGFGAYDGSLSRGIRTGSHTPRFHALFLVSEAGLKWKVSEDELAGRFGAGAWYHSGDFEEFDGRRQSGTTGVYLVFDQLLFREMDNADDHSQGLGCFLQYGYADPAVSPIDHHFGGGFTWTGPIPTRDQDAFGVGLTAVHLSQSPGAGFQMEYEVTTEMFYTLQLTGWMTITGDLQYIANPAAANGQPDALVGTLRTVFNF